MITRHTYGNCAPSQGYMSNKKCLGLRRSNDDYDDNKVSKMRNKNNQQKHKNLCGSPNTGYVNEATANFY